MNAIIATTRRRTSAMLPHAILTALLVACGGPDDSTEDAGTDAFVPTEDAGTDAGGGADGGADPDAGTDAGTDLCADVVCTASDACHLAGVCDPATGTCSDPVADDGTSCEDGLACTVNDTCVEGTCVAGDPADDGTACGCGECLAGECGWHPLGATGTTPGTASPVSLAVDDARAYVGNSYGGVADVASVVSMPIAGGSATAIASDFTGYPDLVLLEGTIYFTRGGDVWSVPADGSAEATQIFAGSTTFYAIATDGVRLYLTTGPVNTVVSLELTGGTLTPLASGEAAPVQIVTDGTQLYWINSGDGTIRALPVAGGTPTTIATGTAPRDLAVDATSVYWTEPTTGEVLKAPLAIGDPTTVASDQLQPMGIMLSDGRVYWTNYHGGINGSVASAPIEGGAAETIPRTSLIGPVELAHDDECVYVLTVGEVFSAPAL